jgi:hypothetical protein
MIPKMKTAISYYRTSSSNEAGLDKDSLERQRQAEHGSLLGQRQSLPHQSLRVSVALHHTNCT